MTCSNRGSGEDRIKRMSFRGKRGRGKTCKKEFKGIRELLGSSGAYKRVNSIRGRGGKCKSGERRRGG